MHDEKQLPIADEEHDVVLFTDSDGNELELEVLDYFFYNGEEFAVLSDLEPDCDCEDEECDCAQSMYIMRVLNSVDENGEEMEEFVPVDESLMDQLIEVVQTRFVDDEIFVDDDEDDEFDDEDFEDDEEDEDE